jgi:hypothetical protein
LNGSTWVTIVEAAVIYNNYRLFACVVVPNGTYYRLHAASGTPTITSWSELR